MPRKTKANPLVSGRAEPYLYLLPTIVLFVFILAVPLFNLFKYSLGDSNIIQGFKEWNSFENFKYLGSPKFLSSVWVTVIYVFFGVLGVVLCGTIVSLALDKPIPGRGAFRAVAIIPWVVPQAFAASMWSWVVNAQFGFINQLLRSLGLIQDNLSFLSENTALATVIIVRIWQGTPFVIISLLAALQTIPEDIQEAADLDGADHHHLDRHGMDHADFRHGVHHDGRRPCPFYTIGGARNLCKGFSAGRLGNRLCHRAVCAGRHCAAKHGKPEKGKG